MSERRFITIHGHFYQPPRENPWLEAVETQDSAHPYHDWNARITAECYAPSASARILDAKDRILRIVNNYSTISFNVGPTLLSWLETHAPATYHAILDADRQSRSAIAQVYNHMILPLANARDKKTQVRWGVRDFETRFGRRPEGMWLPETAVDTDSLEALVDEGIVFTILEPNQGRSDEGIDPTMPYTCELPCGRSITIFFYDGPISRAVAFENLLARGENFANRLIGAFDPARKHPQIVNIATDGETYGHHHRYGEMALAYALHYIEENDLARITNYTAFLADHPPTRTVDIVERTAWSCAHGVERWRSDCGCSTGGDPGWNQRWREPLREALDWLRDEVADIFEKRGADVLQDPWVARDHYIDIVLDRSDECLRRFLLAHAREGARVQTVLELLEMQRNAMLMFTSCGWFFNDVSGIETVQVLHYAARVIQLAERYTNRPIEHDFLTHLAPARSNIAERGTAKDIYEREVAPTRLDLRRVAAHYAVASLFDNFDDDATIYCYRVTRHDFDLYRAGRARMAVASITVSSIITHEEEHFEFSVLHLGETEITGGVRSSLGNAEYERVKKDLDETLEPGGIPAVIRMLDHEFNETPISIRSLFRDEQRRILNVLCNTTLEEAESAFRQLHERYDPLMRFHTRLGIPLPKVLQLAAEFDLNTQLRRLLDSESIPLPEVEARLREARDERGAIDETTKMSLEAAINRVAERFREDPVDIDRLETFDAMIGVIRGMQIHVNLRKPQNDYYWMMSTVRSAIAATASENNGTSARWLELFDALGEKLSISPEARE